MRTNHRCSLAREEEMLSRHLAPLPPHVVFHIALSQATHIGRSITLCSKRAERTTGIPAGFALSNTSRSSELISAF